MHQMSIAVDARLFLFLLEGIRMLGAAELDSGAPLSQHARRQLSRIHVPSLSPMHHVVVANGFEESLARSLTSIDRRV